MNKALKRNKCRYKETGMYLRMLDRRMQPIKDALALDSYMRTFDWRRIELGIELAYAGHMGSFHTQRALSND